MRPWGPSRSDRGCGDGSGSENPAPGALTRLVLTILRRMSVPGPRHMAANEEGRLNRQRGREMIRVATEDFPCALAQRLEAAGIEAPQMG